jgi:hypothetical protein
MKKFHLIGTRTRDLPACSIVPQPTTLPRAPEKRYRRRKMERERKGKPRRRRMIDIM